VPPSAGEILEGHGIITPQRAFHTYVVCAATGDNWDCHGVPNTPVPPPLCSGIGNASLAQCIEGGDEAGIKAYYGFAGVCHQIANRILAVAGVEIPLSSHAHVRATRVTFRRFGLNLPWMPKENHWPNRIFRCLSSGTFLAPERSSTGQAESGVHGSMTTPISAIDPASISEMASIIQAAGLDHPIDKGQLSELAIMQERLQSRVAALAEMHTRHKISSKKYIEELDRALREAERVGEKIIGRKDFHQVFGEMRADQLVDVQAFVREHDG
jgi:hypothetical protein